MGVIQPGGSGGGAAGWALVHSSDAETGPLVSTVAADGLVISGLNIPANHGFVLDFLYRYVNPAGASRHAAFGLLINAVETHIPATATAELNGGSTNPSTNANGAFRFTVPPRLSGYDRGGMSQRTAVTSNGVSAQIPDFDSLVDDAAAPIAPVTSLTIRYICSNEAADTVDLFLSGIRVWELAA